MDHVETYLKINDCIFILSGHIPDYTGHHSGDYTGTDEDYYYDDDATGSAMWPSHDDYEGTGWEDVDCGENMPRTVLHG